VWDPKCSSDPEICTHECMPVTQIAIHGGDKGMHDVCACLRHSRAWVHGCVVHRRTLMCACVHDRGTWRHPFRVGKSACMCTYLMGRHARMRACWMDRHAYVRTCGVNRHAYVRSCGLKSRTLGARLTGEKLVFFSIYIFFGQYG
jgi:hypothetical protein